MPGLLLTTFYTRTTYSLSDAVDTVLGDLALRNNNVVTSGDVGRWMNFAQRTLARDSEAFQITTYIPTVSGTAEYALPSDASMQAFTVEEALYRAGSGTYRPLYYANINVLYAWVPRWRSAVASTPWAYYQRGVGSVGLYPPPAVSGTTDLMVTCAVIPPAVTAPADLFYIPVGLEEAPLIYAKLQASMKDAYGEGRDRIPEFKEEWAKARLHAAQMVSEAKTNEITRMGENALLPAGGTSLFPWDPSAIATPL